MCGIVGVAGPLGVGVRHVAARMNATLTHRGPDDAGVWSDEVVALGSTRLAVMDPTPAGHQPMESEDGRWVLAYNGEIYNFPELRRELGGKFRTGTDTEVLLRAMQQLGTAALSRVNGMFGFALYDRHEQSLLLVRDRFGVKPLYYTVVGGVLYFGSEVKALAAAGVELDSDLGTWREYLLNGRYDHTDATFFEGVRRVRPGHCLEWRNGVVREWRWYDLVTEVAAAGPYRGSLDEGAEELRALMTDSVHIRFRSDVPVGICLSGGLDSSLLVGLMDEAYRGSAQMHAYHFRTGVDEYDETDLVRELLKGRDVSLHLTTLKAADVPELAATASYFQEEPFGGVATLAMTKLFADARREGTVVLLDGQGIDEAWAGYDYYTASPPAGSAQPVQGATDALRPECVAPALLEAAAPSDWVAPARFPDPIANLQYRDIAATKLPRGLRFSDRSSSQASCELREPFLDYRIVEFAFRQPRDHVIGDGMSKRLPRWVARGLLGDPWAFAPKRAVQTPQRDWLRGPLRTWVEDLVFDDAVRATGWLSSERTELAWKEFVAGRGDNAFFVWQWISIAEHLRVLGQFRSLARG